VQAQRNKKNTQYDNEDKKRGGRKQNCH
jgi:hypothetical protein